MKSVKKIFFVAGGILLPTIANLTLLQIENRGFSVSVSDRKFIYDLEKLIFIGAISGEEFLHQVNGHFQLTNRVSENDILSTISSNLRIISLLNILNKKFELILFSDFPQTWFEQIEKEITQNHLFQKIIYSQELDCSNDRPAVFERLLVNSEIIKRESLWVDIDPFRTSLAIRSEIDAIIFVDEFRLRRELQLRSLIVP